MRDRSRITAVLVAALLAVVPLLLPHYTLATSAMTQALGPRDTTVPADASASASPSATLVVTATVTPTATATVTPTLTPSPTSSPSSSATATQTPSPTITPTRTATPKPSATRTATPKPSATRTPTRTPTVRPTATPQAHMTVSPLSINPGGVLTVGGNTFVPGETVYIGLDGAIYASAHADSSGTAPATGFAVPLTTAPGSHTVFIQGGSSNRRVQTTVTITRLIPAIRLDRASAAPNETLCVTGTTFLPYETVTVAVNSVAVASASAAFDGSFTQCFRVPANIISGSNDVTAVGA